MGKLITDSTFQPCHGEINGADYSTPYSVVSRMIRSLSMWLKNKMNSRGRDQEFHKLAYIQIPESCGQKYLLYIFYTYIHTFVCTVYYLHAYYKHVHTYIHIHIHMYTNMHRIQIATVYSYHLLIEPSQVLAGDIYPNICSKLVNILKYTYICTYTQAWKMHVHTHT